MPTPYQQTHWSVISAETHRRAGAIGFAPFEWARDYEVTDIPQAADLPRTRLDRESVLGICQENANGVLYSYACVMAWGSQGARGGRPRVQSVWEHRALIAQHIELLRSGILSRAQAYELFKGAGAIPHLGPSYFTKLLFFFSPKRDCYIMDQWTGKSVNLLTGLPIVRMLGSKEATPLPSNKSGNYQAYCEEIDHMGEELNLSQGHHLEELLMSKGCPDPWPWRLHVRAHWGTQDRSRRYDPEEMHQRYPHIPRSSF